MTIWSPSHVALAIFETVSVTVALDRAPNRTAELDPDAAELAACYL